MSDHTSHGNCEVRARRVNHYDVRLISTEDDRSVAAVTRGPILGD